MRSPSGQEVADPGDRQGTLLPVELDFTQGLQNPSQRQTVGTDMRRHGRRLDLTIRSVFR